MTAELCDCGHYNYDHMKVSQKVNYLFSAKKKRFVIFLYLRAETKFLHGIFFKPTLHDLKRTNLAIVMEFMVREKRYSRVKWPVEIFLQKMGENQ